MREMLFRGKPIAIVHNDYDDRRIATPDEWVLGGLVCDNRTSIIVTPAHHDELEWWVFVRRKTVGQYIGRTDANGVKIFEGDILKCYCIYDDRTVNAFYDEEADVWYDEVCYEPVQYNELTASFELEGLHNDKINLYEVLSNKAVVVGDIWSNPELLEVE